MIALFTALLLSGPALATGGPDLAIEGACPGPATVDMTGLTPNGRFALFTAEDVGTQVFAGGPCPGLALDLSLSSMLVNGRANGAGEIHVSPNLTAFVCGRAVQIVDVATCQTSNVVFVDGDGDGFARPDDCDDLDAGVFPGALETTADGIDQDCDGVDDCFADLDGDGFGSTIVVPGTSLTCAGSSSRSDNDADCDDADPLVNPLAAEMTADGIDQDCDARERCYVDADGDGFGAADGTTVLSAPGDLSCLGFGVSPDTDDCDDANVAISPVGVDEPVDGLDQDCDGFDACWLDADMDGVGGSLSVAGNDLDCTDLGESSTSGDCDDGDPTSYPGAPLSAAWVADGVDRDCDGFEECFSDQDGDGFGGSTIIDDDGDGLCRAVDGELTFAGDCDDSDVNAYPGAPEVCDDKRTNCSDASWSGDGGLVTWFGDDGAVVDLSAPFASGSPGVTPTVTLSTYLGAVRSGRVAVCEGTYNVRLDANVTFSSLTIEGHTGAGTTPPNLDAGSGEHVFETNGPTLVTGVDVTGSIGFYPNGDGDDVSVTDTTVSGTLTVAMPIAVVTLTDVSTAHLEVSGFSETVATGIDAEFVSYDAAWGANSLVDATLGGLAVTGGNLSFDNLLIDQASGVGLDVSGATVTGTGLTIRSTPSFGIRLTNTSSLTAEGPVLIEGVASQAAVVGAGSTLALSDGEVRDIRGYAFDVTGDVHLTGVRVHHANTGGFAQWASVAHMRDGGSLTCDGGTGAGGFVDNIGAVAAIYLENGTAADVYSQDCQWGIAGVNDNAPADLFINPGGPHNYDGAATFHCFTTDVSPFTSGCN